MKLDVIWWNVQRLFQPADSLLARQLGATAERGWTAAAYRAKVAAVAAVLRDMTGGPPPALLGLGEVENRTVVRDLIVAAGWGELAEAEAPTGQLDGYDVTLLYHPAHFSLVGSPRFYNINNLYRTRDIFETVLRTRAGTELLVLTNHWPSRLWSDSPGMRMGLANQCTRIVMNWLKFSLSELQTDEGQLRLPENEDLLARWNRRGIILGDFNDEPFDASVAAGMPTTRHKDAAQRAPRLPRDKGPGGAAQYLNQRIRLYNPSWQLLVGDQGEPPGTCYWNGDWYLLDQVLLTPGLLGNEGLRYVPGSLRIHGPRLVALPGGGTVQVRTSTLGAPRPFDPRTQKGVSDHLPLLFQLEL